MGKYLLLSVVLGAGWLGFWAAAQAGSRIKDITELEGARSNTIFGMGLVVGLKGTGGDNQSFDVPRSRFWLRETRRCAG